MKKILASLIVLALVAPAMADVGIAVSDKGDCSADVELQISGGSAVRGIALVITLDSGATIDDVADVTMPDLPGELKWAYIDYYYTNDTYLGTITESDLPGAAANPIADPAAPGVLDPTGGVSEFVICAGIVDDAGAQAGLESSVTINIAVSGNCTVSVDADTLRGGIVGDALGTVDASGSAAITCGGTCRDKVLAVEGTTAADLYDRYVTEGEDPSCWCWQYQCRGDADGDEETVFISGTFRTYQADLNLLIISWKLTPESEPDAADPRADIDHAEETVFISGTYSVYQNDLNELITNWQKTTAWLDTTYGDGSAGSGACPTYLP